MTRIIIGTRTAATNRTNLKYQYLFGKNVAYPSGWTKRIRPVESSVISLSTTVPPNSIDTKSLTIAVAADNNGGQSFWDENSNAPADITVQADVMFDSLTGGDGNTGKLGIKARMSFNGAYYAYLKPNANVLRIAKVDHNISETILLASSAIVPTLAINTWYTIKLSLLGTTIMGKVWITGTPEPSTWDATATDSTYTSGNKIGIFAQSGTTAWNGWVTNLKSVNVISRTPATYRV